MSSKSSQQKVRSPIRFLPFQPARRSAHSLRLRLMLWYGGLMAIGLCFFGLLVLFLATNSLNNNNHNAVSVETHVANIDLERTLMLQAPFWPQHLDLEMLDIYGSPDINVQVFNLQDQMLYTTGVKTPMGLNHTVLQQLSSGTPAVWYNVNINGEQMLVEATPINAPAPAHPSSPAVTPLRSSAQTPIIGTLLVAKSLSESNTTLLILEELLLLTGGLMLILFLACGWAVIGYTLRPLSELVKTASSIATETAHGKRIDNLSQRVQRPEEDSEIAHVIDAFNEMLTSIEDSTTVQRRFIADASHELRAPLTTIQGNLAFLIRYVEDLPPSERHTMLADAHGETLRLSSLVDELLLLARADANIGQPTKPNQTEPIVELDRTLLNLVRQMRRRLEIEGSPRKIEIGRIEPVRVRGDEESMRRVMVILLENAIKYTDTEKDKGRGKITVSLELAGNKDAILSVSDTGIGIEANDLPHIFERFYRADYARSRQGTGLGLAIAQTLVEQQGGNITAESTPGLGSTFRVSLPLA